MADAEVRVALNAGAEAEDLPMEGGDVLEINETGAADVVGGGDDNEAADEKPGEARIAFVE